MPSFRTLAINGWFDSAFAAGFLGTMGYCIWPAWFGWGPRVAVLLLAPFACAGDPRWPQRLKRQTWILSVGLWIGGLRTWPPLDNALASVDQPLFAAVVMGSCALALWRPLPQSSPNE